MQLCGTKEKATVCYALIKFISRINIFLLLELDLLTIRKKYSATLLDLLFKHFQLIGELNLPSS